MTNEEAIKLLKAMMDEMILVFDRDRREALNTAISALQEQEAKAQLSAEGTTNLQPTCNRLHKQTGGD